MLFSIYGIIINGLDRTGEGRTERKKAERLKFTVHLKLPNIELIPSVVQSFFFPSLVDSCHLCTPLIQFALIRRHKGFSCELCFMEAKIIFVSFLHTIGLPEFFSTDIPLFFSSISGEERSLRNSVNGFLIITQVEWGNKK
jgi:hypothetical protein